MAATLSARRAVALGLALAALLALASCASPAYYWQAAAGHMELLRKAQAIDRWRADDSAPAALKDKLAAAQRIRDFASVELGLPANGSYRSYADLRRPYVAWNVYATAPYSVRLREWCFPVAGCVSYRGYFAREDAEAYAAGLRRAGNDVHVGGVPAYSTLGWFDDPLLNTFMHYPDTELARLIFHELAHQVAYVADDSEFNESFASAVEEAGIARWLDRHGSPQHRASFEQAQQRRRDFRALVLDYRGRLERLYASDAGAMEKAAAKQALLAELQADYRRMKHDKWDGYAGYDRWFGQEINNATLASVGIYTRLVPAFLALLAEEGGDLPRFYAAVKRLAAQDKDERQAQLALRLPGGPLAGNP
jgi:predicted aminopeptidase